MNANTRYRLLEMIRQHAAERLERAGESATTSRPSRRRLRRPARTLSTDATSGDEYDVLEPIGIETPNFAAGLRWWLATDHLADVLACFDRMPFFDSFALPILSLDELTTVASSAIAVPGSELLPGFSDACVFVSFLAFMVGDIDAYRRLQSRAEAASSTVAAAIIDTIATMLEGDTPGAVVERAQDAVDLAACSVTTRSSPGSSANSRSWRPSSPVRSRTTSGG